MKVSTSPNMASVLIIIEFYDLAVGRSLLSFNAPPPPDVPPANIRLTARTRDGSGHFYGQHELTRLLPVIILNVVGNRYATLDSAPKTSGSASLPTSTVVRAMLGAPPEDLCRNLPSICPPGAIVRLL